MGFLFLEAHFFICENKKNMKNNIFKKNDFVFRYKNGGKYES